MREPTIAQLRAIVAIANGESYEAIGHGSRQAGFQILQRLQGCFDGDDASLRLIAPGGSVLTQFGRELARRAENLTRGYDDLIAWMASEANSDTARIAAVPAAIPLVDEAERIFARAGSPGHVRLLSTTDVYRRDLGAGLLYAIESFDIDIAIAPLDHTVLQDLAISELYRAPICMFAQPGHRLSGETHIPLEEIASSEEAIMMSPPGHLSNELITSAAAKHGIRLTPTFTTDSVEVLLNRAENGVGLALVPGDALSVQRLLGEGRLAPRVTVGGQRLEIALSICTRIGKPGVISDYVSIIKAVAEDASSSRW